MTPALPRASVETDARGRSFTVHRIAAENDVVFRLARLTLLMAAVADAHPDGLDRERLGIYEFLIAYPLLLARDEQDPDRASLLLAGFDDRAVAYASPGPQFASAQSRLAHDLANLLAGGLVSYTAAGRIRYQLTEAGHATADRFTSMKSAAYRTSADVIVRRLRRVSDRTLRRNLRTWLQPTPDIGRAAT